MLQVPDPRDQDSFVDAVREAARPALAAEAVAFAGITRSWSEVLDRSGRLASGLVAAGVGLGDRVAMLSANSDRYLELYLAAAWAGGVIAPLNSRWSVEENNFALSDCAPAVLVVGAGFEDVAGVALERSGVQPRVIAAGEERSGWLAYDALLAHEAAPAAARSGDDLWGIFYTGGTTGRSKGVMLSHANVLANARATRARGVFPDGCRTLIVAPMFHMAAGAAMIMTLIGGGACVIASVFDPPAVLELIEQQRVTDALLVPTMIQMLLDSPSFAPAQLAGLERIFYGASPMPEQTLNRIMAAAPHVRFYQAYGMTELSPVATLLEPEMHLGAEREAGRHLSAGRPPPGVEVRVADDEDRPLATGQVGEVQVRGPGVMLGYWNQPEMSRDALRGGWMHTGDGGCFDETGALFIVDRIKDMIVSGGENVYSAEVESAMSLHPDVAQCAVIPVPDKRWGERVHAIVVARPGTQPSAEALFVHCHGRIADYKCPKSIEFVTELPLSAAGKVLKNVLRKRYWQGQSRNVA